MTDMRGMFSYICALAGFVVIVVELSKGRELDCELLFLWITVWGSLIAGKLNNKD